MIEPTIVRELRKEEKQGFLKQQKIPSNNQSKNEIEKLKEIEFIFNLQKSCINGSKTLFL